MAPADAVLSFTVNNVYNGTLIYNALNVNPAVKFNFTEPVDRGSAQKALRLTDATGQAVNVGTRFENADKTVVVTPQNNLAAFSRYTLAIDNTLQSASGGRLVNPVSITLNTGIDSTDKFPRISDSALLDLVQQQTLKYFWDFGHPVSGLARERNTSGNVVTAGGSGFGIMAMIAGINRNFISRADGLARLQKIVGFLKNNAQTFHGAFPHWINGTTGAVVPFSARDNGADLVETSFIVQGLLTARQYFNGNNIAETTLRNDINTIWNRVEWNWFRKNNENVLYWHWSPTAAWDINLQIKGWNECLITYVLAASSPTNAIPKLVYDAGWAGNGSIRNGNRYYGLELPLGPDRGGPLFFEHYSFLGINPYGLSDQYANYQTQAVNHTKINYEYCKANPKGHYGYSASCWGLTASDIPNGYTASSPNNDVGVIAPTAALSSMPYTPAESMEALRFFYYKLGDKAWKEYGFVDAFSLKDGWFANSFLAIDQAPIVVMIENHRSQLLWNLFTSCPEVKSGMKTLGFTAPYL
ncbi:glucoamylase family protein [Segetibacter sp. 3557_3]|uniref:glucoamylase family protein n=1 Tax=Segetibacter sp. 3557_3 TaxID=2547429 RepID=UPI001FB57785|nr:glucoamylase family protein [Segetibacter sp. 3557_3]